MHLAMAVAACHALQISVRASTFKKAEPLSLRGLQAPGEPPDNVALAADGSPVATAGASCTQLPADRLAAPSSPAVLCEPGQAKRDTAHQLADPEALTAGTAAGLPIGGEAAEEAGVAAEYSASTELGASRAVSRMPSLTPRTSLEARLDDSCEQLAASAASDQPDRAQAADGQAPPQQPGGVSQPASELDAEPPARQGSGEIDLSALTSPGFQAASARRSPAGSGSRAQAGGRNNVAGRSPEQGRQTADAAPASRLQGWVSDSKGIFARVQQLRMARRTQN